MIAQVSFEKEGEKLFSSFFLLFEVKRKTKNWAGKEVVLYNILVV